MPIYEYKCSECGALFEVLQKINNPPLKKCKRCGGDVRKVISTPAIQFRGSGWYVTDYGQKNSDAVRTEQEKKINGQKEAQKEGSTPSSPEPKTE